MCKILIILLFCVSVLFSGIAMAEVDDSGRLIVPETSVAPVIDGELDDVWQNVGEEGVLITEIINTTSAVPEDSADLSGTFKVMHDADNFYIYLVIQDSVIDYEFSDWQGDGVEIFFDGDNSKGGSYDGVNDNQVRITVDDVELANIDSSLPVDGSVFKVILTDVGYNIEGSFPLEKLQIVPENTFGFEVQINDNDGGGGRETMIRWFSNDNNSWQDASLFGEAVLTVEPPEPVDPGTNGLVAFYPLDNDVLDASGNGNDGTIVGDPAFAEGKIGMALDFDGTDDLVELGKFDVVGQITLAAWIKADDFEINDARIVTKANEWGGNDHWWMLSTISETSLRFRLKTDDGQDTATLISDPVLEAGVWAHVVASWDGSMMRIYKDGVEVASQEKGGTAVAVDPDVSAAIGSQPSDAFASDPARVIKFFDGLIDEVQIFSRALSEGEIRYLAGFRRTIPENLVLNPSFEEDEAVLDDPAWEQWATWNPAEGAGSNTTIVDTDAADGARSLRIEPVGPENWHFIVLYLPMMVDMDKDYVASFWAKADEPRPLTVQMKATDNSIDAWGATTFDLTTEWAQYSYTSEVLIDNVKLEILCAGSEVGFLLDQVSVVEADTLSGLADVTVVDSAIVSIRYEGTEYVVADGDLMLGMTTRWYVLDGIETLWAEGDPTAPQTVSGTSNPKDGDVGSKADNFNFTLNGSTNISSIDGIDFQETIFPSLVDTIIVFERNGNDVGTFQAIYADGSLGAPVAFVKASDGGPYADTGIDVNGQNAYGVVFKTSVPVQGVRITASGHDTLSISAPAP